MQNALRAIGRYVVTFSRLVAEMRGGIEEQLRGDDRSVVALAMGEAYAAQITNAFFAICEHEADFDEEEAQVGVCLKNEVNAAIKERNDIAHGDWSIRWPDVSAARLRRTKPGRRAGAEINSVLSADELEAASDAIEILTEKVAEFGWLCFGLHPLARRGGLDMRVRDIFRFQKHKGVLRKGRYASKRPGDLNEEKSAQTD